MFEELAQSTKVVGFKQVCRGLKAGEIKKVFLAQDADDELKNELILCAKEAGVELVTVPGKKKLGELCGISVSAACAGIL